MRYAIRSTVLLLVTAAACSDPSSLGRIGPPAALIVVSGQNQQGVVGQELADPIEVRVVDAEGDPVPNQIVNFVVVSGGGSVFAGTALTTNGGIAKERWTLGTNTSQEQKIEARAVDPMSGSPLVFGEVTAIALPDVPASMVKTAGDGQAGVAGAVLPESLVVTVADKFGNPIPAVSVSWSVASGGGSVSPTSAATASSGVARTQWTTGAVAGTPQTVNAQADTITAVTFTATTAAGPPTQLVLQTPAAGASAGEVFATQPIVRIADVHGNTVPSASHAVTISVNSGAIVGNATQSAVNGTVSFSQVGVDATPGEYVLTYTATIDGVVRTLTQPLTLGLGTPTKYILSPTSTSVTAAASFVVSAQLSDAGDRPIPVSGLTVTWSKSGAGGPEATFSSPTSITDGDGVATVTFTPGTTAEQSVTVSATDGSSRTGSRDYAVVAAGAAKLAFVVQPSAVGRDVVIAPAVRVAVQDEHGNTVTSATDPVTVSITNNPGGSTLLGGQATTAVNGVAIFPRMLLNELGSGYTLRAQAAGLVDAVSSAFDVETIGTVATVDSLIKGITIVDSSVYLLEDLNPLHFSFGADVGAVKRASIIGGDTITKERGFRFFHPRGGQIESDGTTLFWFTVERLGLNNSRTVVFTEPVATNAVRDTIFDQSVDGEKILVDDSYVYLTYLQSNAPSRMVAFSKAGGAPVTLVQLGVGTNVSLPIYAESHTLYYALNGSLWSVPATGGTPSEIVGGTGTVGGLVLVAGRLYFTAYGATATDPGSLKSVAVSGGVIDTHVSNLTRFPLHLITDGTSFILNDAGTIRRYALAGFGMSVVAVLPIGETVGTLVTDATHVYWNTTNDVLGRVRKARK